MTATADCELDAIENPIVGREAWLADVSAADPDEEQAETGWGECDGGRRDAWQAGYDDGRAGHPPACFLDVYTHGYDEGARELERVEAAAFADPDAWLTTPQWDALDAVRAAYPTADWNPSLKRLRVGASPATVLAAAPAAAGCRVLSGDGRHCWLDLAALDV